RIRVEIAASGPHENRLRARAGGRQQYVRDAVVLVREGREVLVAKTQTDGQVGAKLPAIIGEIRLRCGPQLCNGETEGLVGLPGLAQQKVRERRASAGRRGGILSGDAGEREASSHVRIALRVELIAADLGAEAEGVLAADQRQRVSYLKSVIE